jgi:MSHA pilin protein MshD
MFRNTCHFCHSGFTFIEVIVTIVVLAIASTAILSVFTNTVSTSAYPMLQQQAISIAEAYMEEISLTDFSDPVEPETGGSEGDENRENYNDIQDYNDPSVDGEVRDQNNNTIDAFNGFTVTVAVIGSILNGIDETESMRIDVTVSHPAIASIKISGYRTSY